MEKSTKMGQIAEVPINWNILSKIAYESNMTVSIYDFDIYSSVICEWNGITYVFHTYEKINIDVKTEYELKFIEVIDFSHIVD